MKGIQTESRNDPRRVGQLGRLDTDGRQTLQVSGGVGEKPGGRKVVLQVDLGQVVDGARETREGVGARQRGAGGRFVFHPRALVGVQGVYVGTG